MGAGRFPAHLPGGYRLTAIEEVTPDLVTQSPDARFGCTIFFYQRAGEGGPGLTVTHGYTSPARVAGAPAGSWGEIDLNGRRATWIAGGWEAREPSALAPADNPAATWRTEGLRLTWQEDLVSTTLESSSLALAELADLALHLG